MAAAVATDMHDVAECQPTLGESHADEGGGQVVLVALA